jgi:hypothetical protein
MFLFLFVYLCLTKIYVFMMPNQVKLLTNLAKQIKSEKKDRIKIVSSLQAAKILTKQENLSGKYNNLKKVISTSK